MKKQDDDKGNAPAAGAPPAPTAPPQPPDPPAPAAAAPADAEDATLPKTVLAAAKALGLKPSHVLDYKERADGISIVTKGGSKLRFPEDTRRQDGQPSRAESLSEPQKDGVPRETGSRNVGPMTRG